MLPGTPMLLPNRKGQEQPQYFFSPAFQCYTSPPFYKNLLNDLQYISVYIDQCVPAAREVVWEQLFILLGTKPATCSKVFGPVLRSWAEAPTINLLAVELLYLSFAISLDKNPDLLKSSSSASLDPSRLPQGRTNAQIASAHRTQRPSYPFHSTQSPHSPQSRQPSQIASYAQRIQQERHMQDQRMQQERMRQDQQREQEKREQQRKTQEQRPAIKESSEDTNATPKKFDFEKLLQLQSWKGALDAQPEAIRQKIWKVWESLTGSSSAPYENITISKTVNTWAKDIVTHSSAILSFHGAVECIKNNFSLDLETPTKARSPSPPAKSSVHSTSVGSPTGNGHSAGLAPVNTHRPVGNSNINLLHPSISSSNHYPYQQPYSIPPLATISRTLRPLTRDPLPSVPQKRSLPSPHNDPKRSKLN